LERSADAPEVSVVIPAYRSSATLPELTKRLGDLFANLGRTFELIVVDDCSPDGTWETLRSLRAERAELRIVRLLRNSGQHNALLCGLSQARGDAVVTMDDDLQNPPEEIPALLDALDQRSAIVILDILVSRMNRQIIGSRIPFGIAEMHE
jgi:undecaprenyl-phosphate 4-deoxy-4-formamido-L-arabinose transferase